jgi:hypothetical protein
LRIATFPNISKAFDEDERREQKMNSKVSQMHLHQPI